MQLLLLLPGPRVRYGEADLEARRRVYGAYVAHDTSLELGFLPGPQQGPEGGVEPMPLGENDFDLIAPFIARRAKEAEEQGYDAVVIHCTPDPGLQEARELVRIPVVGPGEASFRVAAMLSHNIGIVVPNDEVVPRVQWLASVYGVENLVRCIVPINKPIGSYATQVDAVVRANLLGAAREALAQGADLILPFGLAWVPVRVSGRDLTHDLGVTVLDPGFTAIKTAELLAAQR